jgi:Mg2+ and Co2+ transporter CorA
MDIIKFKEESEKVCHYCGKKIASKEDLTVDHVIPLSKGGRNVKDNLVISCRTCNSEKANLNAERYAEFLNITNLMSERADVFDSIERVVNGLNEIITNFTKEINSIKSKLAAAEKKRKALLDSMMFKKFNVIQGYDYAKELRDLTEEIYDLKINLSQMNNIQIRVNQIAPFLSKTTPKSIKNDAVNNIRSEILNDYRAFTDEKPVGKAGGEKEKASAISETPAAAKEQTG